jgi:hypothetical protein
VPNLCVAAALYMPRSSLWSAREMGLIVFSGSGVKKSLLPSWDKGCVDAPISRHSATIAPSSCGDRCMQPREHTLSVSGGSGVNRDFWGFWKVYTRTPKNDKAHLATPGLSSQKPAKSVPTRSLWCSFKVHMTLEKNSFYLRIVVRNFGVGPGSARL